MVRLGVGEPQRPGDGGEDLAGRARRPALLEPHVVLGGDVRADRDFLAAQAGGTASRARRLSDVFGPEALAAAAEEPAQLLSVHTLILSASGRAR